MLDLEPARSTRRHAWISVALFAIVMLGQATNKYAVHSDSMWSLHLAMSVLREGNLDLDEYRPQVEAAGFFAVDSVAGHLRSYFPVAPSLVILPLLAPVDWVCRAAGTDLLPLTTGPRSARAESHVATVVVALATVVLCAALRAGGFTSGIAIIAALVFAFCTTVWSTASRALWQHGPSMLALSTALYSLFASQGRRTWFALAGFALGCAVIIRPTNGLPLVVLGSLVVWRHRAQMPAFASGAALPVLGFAVLNLATLGTVLPPYFQPQRVGDNAAFWEALAGNLVSPGRGLFVYSPVLLVAIGGLIAAMRTTGNDRVWGTAFAAIIALHWIAIASFPHWWGGHSYGPRLFTDTMPFFAWGLAFAFTCFARFPRRRARAAWAVTAVLIAIAFGIHYRGANSYAVHWWNTRPSDIDEDPRRLWDWGDPPFGR
jgi:hypothetical protein